MGNRTAIGARVAPVFVPATRLDRLTKAAVSRADAIIIDLEDAVPEKDKVAAGEALRSIELPSLPLVLRVNGVATPWFIEDISMAAAKRFTAVMLPKFKDAAASGALSDGFIVTIALVETARGLANLNEIARAPSVCRIAFGSVDFAADIGCAHEWDSLLLARSQIVLASRLAGLPAPIDGVTVEIESEADIEADARRAARLGFGASSASIHGKSDRSFAACLRRRPKSPGPRQSSLCRSREHSRSEVRWWIHRSVAELNKS